MSTQPTTEQQIDTDAAAAETTVETTSDASQVTHQGVEEPHSEVSETANGRGSIGEGAEQDEASAPPSSADAEDKAEGTAATDDIVRGNSNESTDLTSGRSRSRRKADLEHEGEVAADFLESLMDIADLDGDLEVNVEGDRAAVAIVDSEDGPAPKRLVGRDGEVLEALQELTRLAVQAETGDRSRLMLDVAGHRAGRRTELVELARSKSAEAKESGARVELEPMSAFERKVVHDEVLASGLASESEGVEPNRYVVIIPSA